MFGRWRKAFKQHWFILRFGPLFFFILILLFFLVGHKFFSDIVPVEQYFTVAVAKISGTAMNVVGIENRTEGTKIFNDDPDSDRPGFSVDLKTGCNGLVATLIFIASILAFPSTWKHKALGIFLGILAIQCFNVLRIGVLFYLGLHHRELFETVHVYVAQSILIAVAAALWLFWSAWVGKQPEVDCR